MTDDIETRSSRSRVGAGMVRPRTTGERDDELTWFFHAEYPQVVRTVYLILRDPGRAEDVAQEAFMTLYARWPRISRYERSQSRREEPRNTRNARKDDETAQTGGLRGRSAHRNRRGLMCEVYGRALLSR